MKFRTKIVICMVWLLALAFGVGGSMMIGSSFHASMEKEKNSARPLLPNAAQHPLDRRQLQQHQRDPSAAGKRREYRVERHCRPLQRRHGLPQRRPTLSGSVTGDTLRVQDGRILVSCTAGTGLTDVQLLCSFDISRVYAQRDAQLRVYYWAFLTWCWWGRALSFLLCTWLTGSSPGR